MCKYSYKYLGKSQLYVYYHTGNLLHIIHMVATRTLVAFKNYFFHFCNSKTLKKYTPSADPEMRRVVFPYDCKTKFIQIYIIIIVPHVCLWPVMSAKVFCTAFKFSVCQNRIVSCALTLLKKLKMLLIA